MRTAILVALLALGACSPDQPFDKPGTWSLGDRPSDNDRNLQVMVVNPHDLVEGQSAPSGLGAEAAPPIARLLSGRRAPLLSSGVLQLQLSDPAQAAPPPAAGP